MKIKKIISLYLSRRDAILTSVYARLIRKPFYTSERNVFDKQNKALSVYLNYSVKYVPYYRKLYESGQINRSDIQMFPFVTKQLITEKFDEFTSCLASKYLHFDMYTGGSTGEPFKFLGGGEEFETSIDKKRWKYLGYKKGDKILALDGTKRTNSDIENHKWLIVHSPKKEMPFGGGRYICIILER